jgi:hypothetical protein
MPYLLLVDEKSIHTGLSIADLIMRAIGAAVMRLVVEANKKEGAR